MMEYFEVINFGISRGAFLEEIDWILTRCCA